MSIVIREQDILKKDPSNIESYWSENAIRGYQESHGINYGATVFLRGSKPYREWSNDRHFNETVQVVEGSVAEENSDKVMQAEIQSLKETIAQMKLERELKEEEETHTAMTGVDRHGLSPNGPNTGDKRTKAYKASLAQK